MKGEQHTTVQKIEKIKKSKIGRMIIAMNASSEVLISTQ
jgi:hypothetical protein